LQLKNKGNCANFSQMSKKFLIMFFLLILIQVVQASEIKAMVGPNWNKYLFSSEIDSLARQQKTGFGIGLGWALALNRKMKLEANALFNEKGANAALEYSPEKTIPVLYKNTSISFPFFYKYQFQENASPYVALGPEFVFILSHHLQFLTNGEKLDLSDNTRKNVLAFNFVLGYEYPLGRWGLFVEIRYHRWLSNFLIGSGASVKSESITIMLGGVYHL